MRRFLAMAMAAALLGGCVALPERNGALGLTRLGAAAEAERMEREPVQLLRPVVVLNGYHGLPTLANRVARRLGEMTSGKPGDFLAISYTFSGDLDDVCGTILREVEARWPSPDPERTIEVDVVGVSMGGIAARWAALTPEARAEVRGRSMSEDPDPADQGPALRKRLRIARLYTISAPHRGSRMAEILALDPATADMRGGSAFLHAIDTALPGAGFELVCYTQCRDNLVGATRTAPPGQEPIWTSGTLVFSHFTASRNPMFLVDIARRLRGETPLLQAGDAPPAD